MKTKRFLFLRDTSIYTLAALLSIGAGLAVSRRQGQPASPPLAPARSSPAVRTIERQPLGAQPLSLAEFRAGVDGGKALIIDARDDIFYARGHVPRALSLPHRRFDARYTQLKSRLEADLAQPIILYCGNTDCDASQEVQVRLLALGYTNVTVFPMGWTAWKTAGYPEEKSDAASVALAPWKNPS